VYIKLARKRALTHIQDSILLFLITSMFCFLSRLWPLPQFLFSLLARLFLTHLLLPPV